MLRILLPDLNILLGPLLSFILVITKIQQILLVKQEQKILRLDIIKQVEKEATIEPDEEVEIELLENEENDGIRELVKAEEQILQLLGHSHRLSQS